MASTNTAPSPPLQLEEFLLLCHITFEAIITAYRPRSVTHFRRSPLSPALVEVRPSQNQSSRGLMPPGTSEEMATAYKKWDLCDHFCFFLVPALKTHMPVLGATFWWARVPTKFERMFVWENTSAARIQERIADLVHSVLVVKKAASQHLVVDGTGEQFGWKSSDWLTDKASFFERAGYSSDFWVHQATDDDDWKSLWSCIIEQDQDKEYWRNVFGAMWKMMKKWNLAELGMMSRAERVAYVEADTALRAADAAAMTWG